MKAVTINLKNLSKNNPRLCLNVNRSVNKCYDCDSYKKCESKIINKKYESKIKKIKNLNLKIDKLKKELKEL